jgi:hypothetical protein
VDLNTFIVTAFCLVDDRIKDQDTCQRGRAQKLSGSEVLTIEIVGRFLGIDADKGLYRYFGHHYTSFFPPLRGPQDHLHSSGSP